MKHYCAANNIDITREANIGRGPVDFKFSHGHVFRALLEVKLVKNSRFWNGLELQLPKYLEAEGVVIGFFMPVILRDPDVDKLQGIETRVRELESKTPYKIGTIAVDARRSPVSASKLL